MSTVGERVRALRRQQGLSQQALAGRELSAGYVSLIESGKRTPSAATTELLAARLSVPIESLLPENGPAASDRAQVDINFARLSLANGNAAEAVRCLSRTDLGSLCGRTAGDAALLHAEALQETGDLEGAVEVLEALLRRCRREQSWSTLATAATALAAMYIESGDLLRSADTARQAFEEVEAAGLRGTDDHVRLGSVLVWALVESGELLVAARHVQELIEVAEDAGSARARGSLYWNAALVAHERGRVEDALRLTDRALALLAEQEESRDVPRLRLNYSWLLLNHPVPRPVEALRQLEQAERHPSLMGSRLDLGIAAAFRGRAHLLLGEVDDAAEQAARALQLLGPSEHIERVSALLLLGDVGLAQRDLELAAESYREADRVLTVLRPSRRVARLWRELGDAWRAEGDLERAVDAYDRSLRIVRLAPRPMSRRVGTARASGYAAAR
jgi:tetratricopeptide (TPR) repeat protein